MLFHTGETAALAAGQENQPEGDADDCAGRAGSASSADSSVGGTAGSSCCRSDQSAPPPKARKLNQSCKPRDMPSFEQIHASCRAFKERLLNDDEFQRDVEAGFSARLVDFLRSPVGYSDLLGLSTAPSTVQHPSLMELLDQPIGQQAAAVAAAMRGVQDSGSDDS